MYSIIAISACLRVSHEHAWSPASASVLQSKTQKPVRFEISEGTRASVATWMKDPLMVGSEFLWSGRFHERLHISTRQYARIVRNWVSSIGLEVTA